MNRSTLNILFFFLITSLLYPVNFSEFSYGSNELEGSTLQFTNDFNIEFHDWRISDLFTIKSRSADKPFYKTYFNNYTRNLFRISKYSSNYFISTWLSRELNTSDTYTSEFVGLDGDFELKDGISSGLDASWRNSYFELSLFYKYIGKNYRLLNTTTNEFDEEHSGDIIAKGHFTYNYSKNWRPFIDLFQFNDLNENNYLGYSKFLTGLEYKNMFIRKYVLKQQLSFGYSDLYENIPYILESDTRISMKLVHKWMAFGKIYFQLYADEKFNSIYSGNSFTEFLVQRNFSINKDNYFARIRSGVVINPVDRTITLKSSFVYPYKFIEFNGEYKFYPGDKNSVYKEHLIDTGFKLYLNNKQFQAGYNLNCVIFEKGYAEFIDEDHIITHRVTFNFDI